jgi:cation diffusion facilitator CzcD-associated flavoprotein CzcO
VRVRGTQSTSAAPDCEIAVVGAGPYGLAAAAHLRAAGRDVRVLGEPMAFWERQMPAGMKLRSPWEASHISDPERALSLDAYEATLNGSGPIARPVPLERFVEYGRWFQRHVVPDLDTRRVESIARPNGNFALSLGDGDSLTARRVVLATGISAFPARPAVFADAPGSLVSHASDLADLSPFAGRDVVVIGGGQSAIESAALLHEAGARVEVLVRAGVVNWLVRSARLHRLRALRRLLYAPADIGPAGVSWLVATPRAFTCLPKETQEKLAVRSIRPAASGWLVPRVEGVRITLGRHVAGVEPQGGRLRLALDDGSSRVADHVLLGTGYRVDVARLDFLAPLVASGSLRLEDGYPVLTGGLESTTAGLHFVGAPAARRYGPLMRFVAGTGFAARALTRGVSSP